MTTPLTAPPTPSATSNGYRWWIAGSVASICGDAAFNVALSWQATAIGAKFAGFVLALPGLVASALLLLAGVATDRFSARRVLLWSSTGFAAAAAAMTLLSATGHDGRVWLVVFAVVIGLRTAVFSPASVALTRQLVPPDRFGNALSLRQLITQLASVLGRPLGGALVALGGLATAAGALTTAYVVALLTVIRTRTTEPTRAARPARKTNAVGVLFEGVTLVAGDQMLRQLVLVTGAAAGLLLPLASLLVPVWARENGGGAVTVGWVVGLIAAASIVVASIVSVRGPSNRLGLVAALGLGLVAVASLGFMSSSPGVAGIAGVAVGTGQGLFATHAAPLVKAVPHEHMGKAQSVITLAQTLAASAGSLALGALVPHLGAGSTAMVWGASTALVAIAAFTLRPFRDSLAK